MKILRVSYQDADGWTLDPLLLNGFNLLVGVSGAGKTRIIRAIERICALALGLPAGEAARGASFRIDFEHDGQDFVWAAALEARTDPGELSTHDSPLPLFQSEHITQGGEFLIERMPTSFLFRGQPVPRLDRAKSAIATLKEDPAMAPLYAAFTRLFRIEESAASIGVVTRDERAPGSFTYGFETLHSYEGVGALGAELGLRLQLKAYYFQQLFPTAFAQIVSDFQDAFPLVENVTVRVNPFVRLAASQMEVSRVSLVLTEKGVANEVPFEGMSSGMQRYLSFLVHLSFAPPGTVVLIDELESSLGVNCLPAATRFLLTRAPDLQLVLTSHHPYIIEQIPPTYWKLVTRQGHQVRVLDASQIPALADTRSHLDRFTRLINLPEYDRERPLGAAVDDQWTQG